MIYLGIFSFLLAGIALTDWASPTRRRLYYLTLIFLFFFSAFRFEVGCDWSGYLNQWFVAETITFGDAAIGRDPLWWTGLTLLQALGGKYYLANVFSNLVFFAGIHHLAKRQADPLIYLALLFPVLIINMPMSAIRQGMAIGILCFAYSAFADRSLRRFLVLVALAAGFHSSAAVFFALAPFVTNRLTRGRVIAAGILALPVIGMLLISSQADLAYTRYVEGETEALGAVFRVLLLASTSAFFLVLLRGPWRSRFPDDYPLILLTSCAALVLFAMLPISTVIADRLGYYLLPLQAMIVVRSRLILTPGQGRSLVAAYFLGLTLFFGTWTLKSSHFDQCYLPYQNQLIGTPVSTKAY